MKLSLKIAFFIPLLLVFLDWSVVAHLITVLYCKCQTYELLESHLCMWDLTGDQTFFLLWAEVNNTLNCAQVYTWRGSGN